MKKKAHIQAVCTYSKHPRLVRWWNETPGDKSAVVRSALEWFFDIKPRLDRIEEMLKILLIGKIDVSESDRPTQSKFYYGNERDHQGYVYLLGGCGYFKIGISKSPSQRMDSMSNGLPFEVKLIHTIETDHMRKLEHELHTKYGHLRSNREWFCLGNEQIAEIRGISNETILET